MMTGIQQETEIIFSAVRPVLLPPRSPSIRFFPLLPSILGKSNHHPASHLISYQIKHYIGLIFSQFLMFNCLGFGLAWFYFREPTYSQNGTYEGLNTTISSTITNNNRLITTFTIPIETIIVISTYSTTTRPTITNSGSSTSSSSNQNTDNDMITNMPTNTNMNTAGRRRRRSAMDENSFELFVRLLCKSCNG